MKYGIFVRTDSTNPLLGYYTAVFTLMFKVLWWAANCTAHEVTRLAIRFMYSNSLLAARSRKPRTKR